MSVQRTSSSSKPQKNVSTGNTNSSPPRKKLKPTPPEAECPTSLVLHAISASVTVDDKELPCYSMELNDSSRTATCYVESLEGKLFCVHIKRIYDPSSTALGSRLYLDGSQKPVKRFMFAEESQIRIEGVTVSNTTVRPFMFSRIKTTDDDLFIPTSCSTADIGSIVLEVRKISLKDPRPIDGPPRHIGDTNPVFVHEKTKLEGSHVTSLGPSETRPTVSRYRTEPLNVPDNDPYLKFVFKYRPQNILLANGIIKSKETVTQSSKRNFEPPVQIKQEGGGERDDTYEVEMLEVEAQEAAAEAQKAAAHAAVMAAKAKKAALQVKAKKKQASKGITAIKDEDGIIDLTSL